MLPFAIDVAVGLFGFVAIVFKLWQELALGLLSPSDEAEVMAVIEIPSASDGGAQPVAVVIVEIGDGTIEVVVHLLLADEVRLEPLVGQPIFHQLVLIAILLIVALSFGIVEGGMEVEEVAETLSDDELIVLLMVIVGLVLII